MSLCTHKKDAPKETSVIWSFILTALQFRLSKNPCTCPQIPFLFRIQLQRAQTHEQHYQPWLTKQDCIHPLFSQAFKFKINLPTLATTSSSCKSQLHHKLMRNLISSGFRVQSQWQCSPFISTEHKGSFSGNHFASGPASSSLSSPGYSCSFPFSRVNLDEWQCRKKI